MKHELTAYTRPGAHTHQRFSTVLGKQTKMELLENVILLLLSRIFFKGYLFSPFGVAYFAAVFSRRRRPFYGGSAILGSLFAGFGLPAIKYCGAILTVCVFFSFFKKELGRKKVLSSVIVGGALFANGLIYVVSEGFFAFDFLLLTAESTAAILSYLVFDKAVAAMKTYHKRTMFEMTETMSVVCLLALAMFSVALLENLLPLAHVLSIFIILTVSTTCGFTVSCAAGTAFGLCLGLAANTPSQMVCIYCVSALAAGALKPQGKIGVSFGFAFAAFAATVLLCPETNGIITLSYVALAALALLFIPDRLLNHFGTTAAKEREERATGDRIRQTVDGSLQQTIHSIDSVSEVFHDVLETLPAQKDASHSAMFDNVADAVCKKCTLCKFCWSKNRESTLSYMHQMFHTLQRKNTLSKAEAPAEFMDMCIRKDAFLTELNKHYEAYKITRMWAGKVSDSKRLVAEQFQNISMILKTTRANLAAKMQTEPELEQKIYAALDRRGLSCDNVQVYNGDGFSVTMDKASCGENLVCATAVSAAVSEVLEVPMRRESRVCQNDVCHLTFSQQTRFVTDIGIASATKITSTGSGDSATQFPCGNGKIALMLSDGCGSGEKAHFQSSVTTRLAQNLLTAGFDKETCVQLINNILMVNADRDTFSTIDLCIVNLYTGTMEFVKTGAVNSYIKTEDGFETVYASSLPAGVVHALEPDYDMRYMQKGDYLIMASDGVTDVLDSPDQNKILALAKGFHGTAKALADRILNAALLHCGNTPTDDMTVLVCAVSENI